MRLIPVVPQVKVVQLWIIGLLFTFFAISLQWACAKDQSGALEQKEIPHNPDSNHPFLIVKKGDFALHQAKSNSEPWSSMKKNAIDRSNAGAATKAYDLQDFVGAAALAYILDEGQAQVHAKRVRDAIVEQYSQLKVVDGGSWSGVVPNLGSFFMAILALDIVYDALSPEDIAQCEEVISSQIFKIDRAGSWEDVRLGTHGTWDIYKGDRTTPDDKYYAGIMRQISSDGVSPVTIHYAWERVGGGDSRLSKSGYMDVLEYTGIDERYYSNEKLQKFQRWLFGSSVNCAKEMAIIGDMLPTQNLHNDMLHRRVGNFDNEAAGYAAWFHEGVKAKGTILTYLLPQAELPAPVEPSSQIYTDGGAFLREKEAGGDGLHLVLYNIKAQDEWHTHQEVNGLAFSGYGNRLLVNGGRLGSPVRAAPLNNTLTVNGTSHASRLGGGIIEGFTHKYFDYACGSSGSALAIARHERNCLLVHAEGENKAYAVIIDEVRAPVCDQLINYLHPANESSVQVITPSQEYLTNIDHYPTAAGARLAFFYATPPDQISIEKVASAVPDRYPNYPDHNRIAAHFTVGPTGVKQMVTILFPENDHNKRPLMTRVLGDGLSGCKIEQASGMTDLVLEASSAEEVSFENLSFAGSALVTRQLNEQCVFYFAKNSRGFKKGHESFQSNSPITIYKKGNEGVILSQGSKITLTGIGVTSLTFSQGVNVLRSGQDLIEIEVPKGKIQFSN